MSEWKKYMDENDAFADSVAALPHNCAANPYLTVLPDEDDPRVRHLFYDAHIPGASTWMHLIIGSERALLIDTGMGAGDLKGAVDALTGGKPLDVVNTHFHGDHSGGNGQFDRVYCPEQDVPYLKAQMVHPETRMRPLCDEKDLVPISDQTEVIPYRDGYRFRLGDGEELEAIYTPGHTAGGCMLLDHKSGILYSGDAVLSTPTLIIERFPNTWFPEGMTVTAFRDSLVSNRPRLQAVRKLCPGHGKQGIDPGYLEEMIGCLNQIIDHPELHELYDYVDDPGQRQIMCVGRAMAVYSDSRIR